MSSRRLVWIETCPACGNPPHSLWVRFCLLCSGRGEIRTELTDAEREAATRPADHGEAINPEWVMEVLPNTSSYGRRGDHDGKLGEVSWQMSKHPRPDGFCLWLNGSPYDCSEANRGQFRRLCESLGVGLKEGAK